MKKIVLLLCLSIAVCESSNAQFWKKKEKEAEKKDTTTKEAKEEGEKEKKKGGGFFGKVVTKIAKVAGKVGVGAVGTAKKVNTLEEVDVFVQQAANIYPKELGLALHDFWGGEWVDGDMIAVSLLNKSSAISAYTWDGSFNLNDKPLKHQALGVHANMVTASTKANRVSFATGGSEFGSFSIPVETNKIKLTSINNQTSNISLDLTKDVELQVANAKTNALVRVDIVIAYMGIRSAYLVGYFKPAEKILVPALMFKHIETKNKGVNFKNSYINVSQSSFVETIDNKGYFTKPLQLISGSNDGKWVTVTNNNKVDEGIEIKSEGLLVQKGNASFSRPLSFAKKIALGNITIKGTTAGGATRTNRLEGTVTTIDFSMPEIPESYLNETLQEMYNKYTAAIKEVLGKDVLAPEIITSTKAFAENANFITEEFNEQGGFVKHFKNSAPLGEKNNSIAFQFKGLGSMLKEAKVDAILKIEFLVAPPAKIKDGSLETGMTIEMVGMNNGGLPGGFLPTSYFKIQMEGVDYKVKNKTLLTEEEFKKITQIDFFVEKFKKALTELKAKEMASGEYEKYWSAQQ